ncbi:MAG: glycosyltransferase [Candidatus Omnitrophica bacterium]|nr:glycosyltransferase [Candidatus Omnitrophota bacterium]
MINIFILIDALGWNYIKDRPFLNDIATTKMPVRSILGFSSGVIPSILTGKYPQEHKHWSLYYYSPKTSPFSWTKALLWLPDNILNSRITRKIIEEISKRLMGYTGYFETYLIPIRQLHLFDICEKKNIYAPKGIGEINNIFDILKNRKVDYKCFNYPLKDQEILAKAKKSLRNDSSNFYFLYLSEFDALLHSYFKPKAEVKDKVEVALDNYEKEIRDIYRIAKNRSAQVNLYIFSDHGMSPVNEAEDLKADIENLGFKTPDDYLAFYDSTMARFWFHTSNARDKISYLLKNRNYGRILAEEEIRNLGIDFKDNMYGEVIFLMNTGVVINPSYMGNKAPQGMHGYDVDEGGSPSPSPSHEGRGRKLGNGSQGEPFPDSEGRGSIRSSSMQNSQCLMDAVLVSNCEVEERIEDVKDIFKLMTFNFPSPSPSHEGRGKFKILYFLNSVVRAGVEEHVLGLLKNVDKNKFEVILVCPQELIALLKRELEELKVKYYAVNIRRWRSLGEIIKFIRIIKKEKPDIVNSHLFGATKFAAPLAKLCGVPTVIETAHLREAWRKGLKKAYFIDRIFYRYVDRIISVSNAVKDYLVSTKKLDATKITVIHNGVDLGRFKKLGDGSLPAYRQAIGEPSPFVIGVIGRLEAQKGHRYFLEAVGLLDGNYGDVRFVIVGDGNLRKELEEQAHKLGIADRVEFLGYRKDIENVLREINLLVLPSLYEGLPLATLEAGAMGKPVIATNVDGSPEVIINNETGLIVSAKDGLALKEGMELFLKNKALVNEFGEKAAVRIKEKFNLKKQIAETEGLYLVSLRAPKGRSNLVFKIASVASLPRNDTFEKEIKE